MCGLLSVGTSALFVLHPPLPCYCRAVCSPHGQALQRGCLAPNKDAHTPVIGAGSGGMGCGRRAASYGASVCIIEKGRLGGTCVNVGCVPKKVMYNCAVMAEHLHDAAEYGFPGVKAPEFAWNAIKNKRDAYVKRLNGIYDRNLSKDNITLVRGEAKFLGPTTLEVSVVDRACLPGSVRRQELALGELTFHYILHYPPAR